MSKTITAIYQQHHQYNAIRLRKKSHSEYELIKVDNSSTKEISWRAFCQRSADLSGDIDFRCKQENIIAGFDTLVPACYRLHLPDMPKAQMHAAVTIQAESLLPLPLEQLRLLWHKNNVQAGLADISLMACRKDQAQAILRQSGQCLPGKIIWPAQAIFKAWHKLCGNYNGPAVMVYIDKHCSHIAYGLDGHLIESYINNFGWQQAVVDGQFNIKAASQLSQDIFHCCGRFAKRQESLPVYIIASQQLEVKAVLDYLQNSALEIIATPINDKIIHIASLPEHSSETSLLYHNFIAVGMALAVLDENDIFDLSADLNQDSGQTQTKHKFFWAWLSAAAVIVLALTALALNYQQDIKKLDELNEFIAANEDKYDLEQLRLEENTRKLIASQRGGPLELLVLINDYDIKNVQLDVFSAGVGKSVNLSGSSGSREKIYEFAEKLQQDKEIKNASHPVIQKEDDKKQMPFSFNFDYKLFAQRKR